MLGAEYGHDQRQTYSYFRSSDCHHEENEDLSTHGFKGAGIGDKD
jgi:hypothetical protein